MNNKKILRKELFSIIDEICERALSKVNPRNIVARATLPNSILFGLMKESIRKEMIKIKKNYKEQINVIISRAEDKLSKKTYNKKVLEKDFIYVNSNKNKSIRKSLLEYYENISKIAKFLLYSDSTLKEAKGVDFDTSSVFNRGEIYDNHKKDINLDITFLNISIDYTSEAIRVLKKSEEEYEKDFKSNKVKFKNRIPSDQ